MKFFKEWLSVDSAFFCGWLSALAIMSLAQDWHGKEKYLEMIQARWHDPYYSVPIALVVLTWSLLSVFVNRQKTKS